MKRKVLTLLCLWSLVSLAPAQSYADVDTYVETMTTRTVLKVHLFENPDEGAFFTFDDDSEWVRSWCDGPVYFLTVGQQVEVTPMTDAEAKDHQGGWYPMKHPHWILLDPQTDRSSVGIVFKID